MLPAYVTEPPPLDDEHRTPPPHSPQMEQAVLGALLLDNSALAVVGDLLAPTSFYLHEHKHIFAAILALVSGRKTADALSVWDQLRNVELHEDVDLAYLVSLSTAVASTQHVRQYAEAVAERATERELLASIDSASRLARDGKLTLDARMERIAAEIMRVDRQRKSPMGRRVPLMSLQALQQASEAVRWQVKHVIPADSIGMLFGGSGTFKSFIALDAALHVAHGLPWMGRKTTAGPVIYIAAEGGAGLWQRINAWHRARNLHSAQAPVYVVPVALDLTTEAWRVVEAAQIAGVEPAMVVVDTLSQTYAGEENSANEMAAYLRELGGRFRALWHCSVLLIHHSGHQASERPRGSSAIRANLDYLLGVHRDEKEMLATVSCIKQKDGELFDDAVFKLTVHELGFDEDGDKITSLVARHLGTEEAVQAARQEEARMGRGGRQHAFMELVDNGMAERDLRRAFYELLPELDAEAKRKAYGRAKAQAMKAGEFEVVQGIVVLPNKPVGKGGRGA